MDQQMTEAGYLGINALGTIVAAIGATPGHAIIPDQWKNDFSIIGNALQAAGNTGEVGFSTGLDAVGDGTQALGNSLVIHGLITQKDGLRTIMIGNWLQALGGTLTLQAPLVDEERDWATILSIIGNLLQIAGNSLQAASVALQRTGKTNADQINLAGGWVQALGASLSYLSATT
ncbi:hypothetical protein [Sporolactobacillus sp. THM19-2]|uniref:DUF6944 family repetitive protein n=1 Tax=Sporolactobacillus sp. THM19-2 TaxID=2511171 RepID=UPI00102185A4|nr:hypothetical protein [Sporolactobacillus sp. THM19-2]RYL91626.1 hypothetical protein EWH91_08585 [Sporolactobacillus sp. THM19-2]